VSVQRSGIERLCKVRFWRNADFLTLVANDRDGWKASAVRAHKPSWCAISPTEPSEINGLHDAIAC
jgi:hypothetical protein